MNKEQGCCGIEVSAQELVAAWSGSRGEILLVANPRAVRHFAQAMMQRSKNDAIDAKVLWEFVQRMPFTEWQRPSEKGLALWAVSRRLQALTK